MAVHPRTGIRSIREMKDKRAPLRISVREDPTHSTLVLIEQIFGLHGFTMKDFEGWGGRFVVCGSPFDDRRMQPLRRGEIDAIFDEGIKTWLPETLENGLVPLELETAILDKLVALGWRRVVLPKSRFPRLARDYEVIDFSGWPIYCNAALPEKLAYDACAALAAREAEIPWEKSSYEGIAQIGRDTEATPIDVPLHPGAERWYREHAGK